LKLGRCLVLATVLGIILIFGYFIVSSYNPSTETKHVGFTGIAKANPYLASERLLRYYDYKVTTVPKYSTHILHTNIDLLIIPISALPHEDAEIAKLEQWLYEGGGIITGNVPQVQLQGESLPVRLRNLLGLKSQTILDITEEEEFDLEIQQTLATKMEINHQVSVHQNVTVLAGSINNAFAYQHDNILFFNDLNIFSNEHLRDDKHATVLFESADFYPAEKIVIINSVTSITAWKWIWNNAKLPLALFALCLLAFILKYTKRFGPISPVASLDRRQLLEHINASGQYLWRFKQQKPLYKKAASELHDFVIKKHPYLKGLKGNDFHQELSEITGVTKDKINEAFSSSGKNEEDFLQNIQTLKNLRQKL
jgi:hypothetical protein